MYVFVGLMIYTKDKVIGSEDLSEGAGADRVHSAWLQIH